MTTKAESFLGDQGRSETAATVGNRLFPDTSVMTYRVSMQTALGGLLAVDVDAESGDRAAELALQQAPGSKVTLVDAAPPRPGKAA